MSCVRPHARQTWLNACTSQPDTAIATVGTGPGGIVHCKDAHFWSARVRQWKNSPVDLRIRGTLGCGYGNVPLRKLRICSCGRQSISELAQNIWSFLQRPSTVNLPAVAARVTYVGSPYHKDAPSFAGRVPRPRPDASICPRHLASRRADIQKWLADSILLGYCGALWEGSFPRYVWHREGHVVYEARLIDSARGEYKGYPLEADEKVRGLP